MKITRHKMRKHRVNRTFRWLFCFFAKILHTALPCDDKKSWHLFFTKL